MITLFGYLPFTIILLFACAIGAFVADYFMW